MPSPMPSTMPSPTTTTHHPRPASGRGQGERSLPPRQRAFTLYCEGHRSPAIAARLNVPERTIRAWLQADLRQLADDAAPQTRRALLQLAITRQLAIATAAWDAYHAAATHHDPSSAPLVGERPGERPGKGYLRLAHAAYREIARLQGLFLPAPAEPQQVRIILERLPNADEATPPASPAATAMPAASDMAVAAPSSAVSPPSFAPAHAAPAATAPAPESAVASVVASSVSPAETAASPATQHAATPPPPRVGEGAGGEVAIPAETATATPPPPRAEAAAGRDLGGLWPGYGPHDILPPHIADAIGLPRFRQRNRQHPRPLRAHIL